MCTTSSSAISDTLCTDLVRDVGDEALELQLVDDLLEHAAVLLALGLALELERHGDFDLLVERHAGEVDVQHLHAEVVVLHFLDEHLLALAVEAELEQVRAVVEVADDFLLRQRDGDDGLLVAVDDARAACRRRAAACSRATRARCAAWR